LINDILDLSKIESGQMELELKDTSLHDLILNVISVLSIKAAEKGISLDYEPQGAIPETIVTDGVRLKQTVINLVGNAIKFTEDGGVLIRPELTQSEGRAVLEIHVADTGIGMSEEAMAKIFDPFSQADTSITRRFGGTGLGLSISRNLAEKLGGNVTVRSEQGLGSIFTITIDPGDLSDVKLLTLDQLQVRETRKTDTVERFQMPSTKILIVDDGEANRELVALFLKRAGIDYKIAFNGKMAVEMVNAESFDAVLMDMHMPVMDGFEATGVLREQGFDLPIIALTADAMAQDERKCRAAGCSDFLPKPIKRDRLYETLRTAIPEKAAEQGLGSPERKNTSVAANAETSKKGIASSIQQLSETKVVDIDTPFGDSADNQTDLEDALIVSELPMDDEDFVMIVQLFKNRLKERLVEMDNAANETDFKTLAELGHWLKGCGGTAGFSCLMQPGQNIEAFANSQEMPKVFAAIKEVRSILSRIHVPEIASTGI